MSVHTLLAHLQILPASISSFASSNTVEGFTRSPSSTVADLVAFGLDRTVECDDWIGDDRVSFMRNATDVLYYLKKELYAMTE